MADLRESFQLDHEEAVRAIVGGMLKDVWTALPVVVSADSDGHTVRVQPTVKGMLRLPDGTSKQVSMPELQDVPVHFIGGGGTTTTHPVKKGDEGIVVFMGRNHDQVQQNGGEQKAGDLRNHSLSDARYIPGGRSDPRKLPAVSTAATQVRTDDGKHYVETHPTTGTKMSVADGKQVVTAHPTDGLKMAAENGAHTVTANASGGVKAASTKHVTNQGPKVILTGNGAAGGAEAANKDEAMKNAIKAKAQADLAANPSAQNVNMQATLPSGASYTYNVSRNP